jgi:hypothetical protein
MQSLDDLFSDRASASVRQQEQRIVTKVMKRRNAKSKRHQRLSCVTRRKVGLEVNGGKWT